MTKIMGAQARFIWPVTVVAQRRPSPARAELWVLKERSEGSNAWEMMPGGRSLQSNKHRGHRPRQQERWRKAKCWSCVGVKPVWSKIEGHPWCFPKGVEPLQWPGPTESPGWLRTELKDRVKPLKKQAQTARQQACYRKYWVLMPQVLKERLGVGTGGITWCVSTEDIVPMSGLAPRKQSRSSRRLVDPTWDGRSRDKAIKNKPCGVDP
jgi:hypothetical protein